MDDKLTYAFCTGEVSAKLTQQTPYDLHNINMSAYVNTIVVTHA